MKEFKREMERLTSYVVNAASELERENPKAIEYLLELYDFEYDEDVVKYICRYLLDNIN